MCVYDGNLLKNYFSLANSGYARLGLIKAMVSGEYQDNDEVLSREGLNKQKPFEVKWGDLSKRVQGVDVNKSNADLVYLRNPKLQANNIE